MTTHIQNNDSQRSSLELPKQATKQKNYQKSTLAQTMGKSLSLKGNEVSEVVGGGSKKNKNQKKQNEDPFLIISTLEKYEEKLRKKRKNRD